MTMKIIALSSALGAEVVGIDLKNKLSQEVIKKLKTTFLKYHLLLRLPLSV